jgi:hypothetical protein
MHTHIYTHTVKSDPPAPAQPAFGKIKKPPLCMVWFQNFNQNGEEVLQLKKKKKKKIDEKVRRT